MGNAQSGQKTSTEAQLKSLPHVVDYIATNFILTQNFRDLEKLNKPEYCEKLIIMTSKVIGQKLNDMEVKYLAQRYQDGVEINEMTNGKVIYLNKDNLGDLDVKNSTNKRRLCIGIARFYVLVAHLFAAIVGTINPRYTYTDSSGAKQTVGFKDRASIPSEASVKISKVGICSARINALLNGENFKEPGPAGDILVNPTFCNINANKTGLEDEPGIPELKKLYYDEYDFDEGKGFYRMTPEMQKVYADDVKQFYKEFTGNTKVPDDIKQFSDIKLRDFQKSKGCGKGGVYTKGYSGTLKEELFKKYADTVKQMMDTANAGQDKLLNILDRLFKFSFDQVAKKKQIIINPELTYKSLSALTAEARQTIVSLYLNCEKGFIDGLEVFEAIVQKQILDTSKSQLLALEKSLDLNAAPEALQEQPPRRQRSLQDTAAEQRPEARRQRVLPPLTRVPRAPVMTPARQEGLRLPQIPEERTALQADVREQARKSEEAAIGAAVEAREAAMGAEQKAEKAADVAEVDLEKIRARAEQLAADRT